MRLLDPSLLAIALSVKGLFSILLSHFWISVLSVAAAAVVGTWVYRLYRNRLTTLSGMVTVDGELLPSFQINLRHGVAPPHTWQLQQQCAQGVYVIYGVPIGELTVEFVWGTGDSCKVNATLKIEKGANLFDIEVSLDLEDLEVNRTVTGNHASTTVSWKFPKPGGSPTPASFETAAFKFIYWISHDYKDKTGSAHSFPGPEEVWPQTVLPSSGAPWAAQILLPDYPSSNETELWSVEVCVDGFREARKTAKKRK